MIITLYIISGRVLVLVLASIGGSISICTENVPEDASENRESFTPDDAFGDVDDVDDDSLV